MNPRRIFWILFAAAALWYLLGTRFVKYQDPVITNPPPAALQRIHLGLGGILHWTIMPVSYAGELVQTQIARLAPSAQFQHVSADEAQVKDVLIRRIADLEKENKSLRGRMVAFEDLEKRFPNLNPKDFFILTNRVGGPLSMNGDNCLINSGTASGVRIGMPVLCNFAIAGKIVQVGAVNAVVRLTTDPAMKIGAVIKRGVGPQARVIARCVIVGQGQGLMVCNSIPKTSTTAGSREIILPPQPGDRLYIDDPAGWHERLQDMEFGVITEVADSGTLHYAIKARPSEDLLAPRSSAGNPEETYDGLLVIKLEK